MIPVRLNGVKLKPIQLIERLNKLGGAHGIGRSDIVESRLIGIKSREIYEAPAAAILLEAHNDLERLVCDRDLLKLKATLAIK